MKRNRASYGRPNGAGLAGLCSAIINGSACLLYPEESVAGSETGSREGN